MDELREAALIAVRDCMGVQENETVLIVTDAPCRDIGQALFEVAQPLCTEVLLLEMVPRKVNGAEPPEAVTTTMQQVEVVIAPTSRSLTHTDARRRACAAGARVGTMPGITRDMMVRTMRADYQRIARLTEKVSEILTNGKNAHLTTPLGTDILIPIEGIRAISSTGLIHESGRFGNLPSGESYLMPEEGKAEGVFFVDGSLAGIGKITSQPVKITVEAGMAIRIEGGPEAAQLEEMIQSIGPMARNLAELGVGTNYMAQITGQILEDEKVLGTVHLALGNNVSMGGSVNVGFHVDGVITRPTLKIDDFVLLKDGRLMIEE